MGGVYDKILSLRERISVDPTQGLRFFYFYLEVYMKNNVLNPLGTERIERLLPKYAVPSIISLLIGSLYNIVDQIFVGHGVGYLGNCATSILFPLTVIGLAFALMIGDGLASHLSLCQGRNETGDFDLSLGNGLVLGTALSVMYMAVFYLFTDKILKTFGATEVTLPYAREYGVIIFAGMPFYIVSNLLSGVIRADGSPQFALLAMLSGAVFNIVFDPILIFGAHMGVAGAAAATILGQILSCGISLVYLRKSKTFRLKAGSFCPQPKAMVKALPLGFPSFLTQFAIVLTSALSNMLLAKYGVDSRFRVDIPVAVVGIVMKVFSIVVSVAIGLIVGSQPILGFNYGLGNYKRVRQTFNLVTAITAAVAVISTLFVELFPQTLIRLFGSGDSLYFEFAELCFRIYLSLILFTCYQKIAGVFLQAIGKPAKAIIVSISRDLLFLFPAMLIMSHRWGIMGLLWSAPAADALAFIVSFAFTAAEIRKLKD